jgi:hypothetical protein
MKISEYRLLEEAWDRSFGFQLNRIEDEIGPIKGRDATRTDNEVAKDRCFSEFILALEELGVQLGDLETVRKPLPPPGVSEEAWLAAGV